jgi:hypothetical protein
MLEDNVTPQNTESSMIYVLGVAGGRGAIELYGVNGSWEVTMHGWFNKLTGYSVLSSRPPCLIAADNDTLSSDMIDTLRERGHSVVIMPSSGLPSQSRYKRSAKDVCQLAMGLADTLGDVRQTATTH